MKTSRTTAHSVRTVARLSIVICHQVSGLSMILSTIHQMMRPMPSMGATNLQGRKHKKIVTVCFVSGALLLQNIGLELYREYV